MFSGALTPTPACTHSSRQLAGCQWETLSVQVHHVPGPGHLVLLLQTGDVVYRLPPTRSDAKAGVARTRRQVECPHRDPRPPRLLAGDLPEMGSGSAGLACPQLPCTRGFSSAFWLLHLRVHSRPKTTRHHWKALIQNVQSRQEKRPRGDTRSVGDAATVTPRGQRHHTHATAAVTERRPTELALSN